LSFIEGGKRPGGSEKKEGGGSGDREMRGFGKVHGAGGRKRKKGKAEMTGWCQKIQKKRQGRDRVGKQRSLGHGTNLK